MGKGKTKSVFKTFSFLINQMRLWHGTTDVKYESIRNKGLKWKSSLSNRLHLPLFFALFNAEIEKCGAVILRVDGKFEEDFYWSHGGFAMHAYRSGEGKTYLNKRVIPPSSIRIVDQLQYEEAMKMWNAKGGWRDRHYRRHLVEEGLGNLVKYL